LNNKINVVWIKRDLRTIDHEALETAEKNNLPYLIIFIFDTDLINQKDCSFRHLQFIYQSISDMNIKLKQFGKKVEIFFGDSSSIFKSLTDQFDINNLYSYRESGTKVSWERDMKINKLLKINNVKWTEFQRDGILRGIKNRNDWNLKWKIQMHKSIITNTYKKHRKINFKNNHKLPKHILEKLTDIHVYFQPGGETNGWKYLKSFTNKRAKNYLYDISKPNKSRTSCSRLSPYISWGNLSVRLVYQHLNKIKKEKKNIKPINAIISRLHWHCHFIQKFEVDCSYETDFINKGFKTLKRVKNEKFIKFWENGLTGIPLVDANIRAVKKTGWINFRMRAMLVSFFVHNLDQDWRDGVYFLARQFLDYEPGIHYPQFQMQAGTTGVNLIRVYNPIKNSKDHDSKGEFIKKWIPELKKIPIEFVHEPWLMSDLESKFYDFKLGIDYPHPIVDLKETSKTSKEKIWKHLKNPRVLKEKKRILKVHVNKKTPTKS
jgi:deoxyribodipyrimidine photo-lyase